MGEICCNSCNGGKVLGSLYCIGDLVEVACAKVNGYIKNIMK